MGEKQLLTPILISVGGKQLKLLYINFMTDGSIYFYFPRESGYIVRGEAEINFPFKGEHQVSLIDPGRVVISPYISFHPGKGTIHINAGGEIYKKDRPVLSMATEQNVILFPLCQIIFPTFEYLDEFNSSRYQTPLTLHTPEIKPDRSLSVDLWIHDKRYYLDPHDRPYSDIRKKTMDMIGAFKYQNPGQGECTASIILEQFVQATEVNPNKIPGIVILISNQEQPYSFELVPAKK